MDQNFSVIQLLKFCKKTELEDNGFTHSELVLQLEEVSKKILTKKFEFNFISYNNYLLVNELSQKLVLRKLNDNIKRLYKDEQANRRLIISQVKTLLSESCPMWILKTDISSFYDSINKKRLFDKLKDDSILSFYSICLLEKLFSNTSVDNLSGLPRGLNLSSTLSEIYMRRFDKWVRCYKGVYYYARFVDDIIVFASNKETISQISDRMNENLEEGLKKNINKTALFDGNDISDTSPLEYLGYKFTVSTKQKFGKTKKKKELHISIARKKVKKLKSRIIHVILAYLKDRNFELLENRMDFLTGNYSVRRSSDGRDLKAGIYYNYSHISDLEILDELNLFYRKTLCANSSKWGKRLNRILLSEKKAILLKKSFKHGFVKKVYNSFSSEEMKKIKQCWNE